MCVISDHKGVLGLSGIIGGTRSGTELDTNNILLYSSYFKPLFKQLSTSKSEVYFIGTKHKFIEKSIQNIQVNYPDLNIIGSRDGYFKDEEELKLHMQLTYKQAVEIAEEQAINVLLEGSKYELIKKQF